MDVGELLAYKPEKGLRHGLEDGDDDGSRKSKKKALETDSSGSSRKRSRLTGMSRSSRHDPLGPPSSSSHSRSSRAPPPTPPRNIPPPTPPRNIPPPTPPRTGFHKGRPGSMQPPSAPITGGATRTARHEDPRAQDSNGRTNEDVNDQLETLEEENGTEAETPLDSSKVKKLVLNFDKKMMKNQELRIKFPDDPRKFMESEVELHDAIEELHTISVAPQLYPLLTPLNLPHNLIALVGHENTDIAAAVVDLLQEMTTIDGVDVSEDEQDGLESLVESLLEEEIMPTLVHSLSRLDEAASTSTTALSNPLTAATTTTPEAQAVHNTLAIIENLIDCRSSISALAGPSGLLAWLLKKLRAKVVFEPNKLYASEILAICVQETEANRQLIGETEGIDILLQQLAMYKRHDPSSPEEQELMENLFDILCSCLLLPANRELFLKGEGLQLMNLMLREKKLSRNGALRVLDHAVTGPEGADCCNKLVDILGLRTVFPLFMKTPSKHGKKGLSKQEHEGHVLSIIQWMLRNCRTAQKQRLMSKFLENDHEKVDRLMELHFSYLDRVMSTDRQLEKLQQGGEELSEDAIYLRRLDGGLFTLQIIDYIMLCICANGPPAIKRRVIKILNLRNASVKTIKNIVREYVSNLGEGSITSEDEMTEEQHKLLDWLDKFQNM